jgi:hypothetical protein
VQNDHSGARRQRKSTRSDEGDVLSPAEAAALDRGRLLKRYVRAAGALVDLFDDTAIADAVAVNRGAVRGWWEGAKMQPATIQRLADATSLSFDELTRFVYFDGPPPRLPEASGPSGLREGVRRAEERPDDADADTPARSPERLPRDAGAGRG